MPSKGKPFPRKEVRIITASRPWSFYNIEVDTRVRHVLLPTDRANENEALVRMLLYNSQSAPNISGRAKT